MPDAVSLPSSSVVARFSIDAGKARHVFGDIAEGFDSPDAVTAAFEDGYGEWTIAIHFRTPPNEM